MIINEVLTKSEIVAQFPETKILHTFYIGYFFALNFICACHLNWSMEWFSFTKKMERKFRIFF